jgi:hypothetical protein
VFLVLAHYRRRILHFNVIRHNVFLQDRREPSERNDEGGAMAAGIADCRLEISDCRLRQKHTQSEIFNQQSSI